MSRRGFTLIEVLTALALLSAAVLSVAQLIVATSGAVHTARRQTSTVALAVSRMEELRSLTWGFDTGGSPASDGSTNLASEPPGSGGAGLAVSPPGTLEQDTPGYVDFLNAAGRWISSGPAMPPSAVFVRRWAIEAPADGASDSLVIQVVVRPVAEDVGTSGRRPLRARAEARLLTLRTRVAR